MPVTIRLSRQGAKKRPQYQIVATEKSRRRDGGAVLERLGYYFPRAEKPKDKVQLNLDAVKKWQSNGAQVSERVGQLLKILSK